MSHIVSECSKLAQLEYKRRHDKVAGAVHWSLCNKYSVQCSQQWYQHTTEPVIDKENVKILWDVNIQTDHLIKHRRPEIVVVNKENNRALLMNIAVLRDKKSRQKGATEGGQRSRPGKVN